MQQSRYDNRAERAESAGPANRPSVRGLCAPTCMYISIYFVLVNRIETSDFGLFLYDVYWQDMDQDEDRDC